MNSVANVRLASLTDAEELSRLNQEFNGGVKRPNLIYAFVSFVEQDIDIGQELTVIGCD